MLRHFSEKDFLVSLSKVTLSASFGFSSLITLPLVCLRLFSFFVPFYVYIAFEMVIIEYRSYVVTIS